MNRVSSAHCRDHIRTLGVVERARPNARTGKPARVDLGAAFAKYYVGCEALAKGVSDMDLFTRGDLDAILVIGRQNDATRKSRFRHVWSSNDPPSPPRAPGPGPCRAQTAA